MKALPYTYQRKNLGLAVTLQSLWRSSHWQTRAGTFCFGWLSSWPCTLKPRAHMSLQLVGFWLLVYAFVHLFVYFWVFEPCFVLSNLHQQSALGHATQLTQIFTGSFAPLLSLVSLFHFWNLFCRNSTCLSTPVFLFVCLFFLSHWRSPCSWNVVLVWLDCSIILPLSFAKMSKSSGKKSWRNSLQIFSTLGRKSKVKPSLETLSEWAEQQEKAEHLTASCPSPSSGKKEHRRTRSTYSFPVAEKSNSPVQALFNSQPPPATTTESPVSTPTDKSARVKTGPKLSERKRNEACFFETFTVVFLSLLVLSLCSSPSHFLSLFLCFSLSLSLLRVVLVFYSLTGSPAFFRSLYHLSCY